MERERITIKNVGNNEDWLSFVTENVVKEVQLFDSFMTIDCLRSAVADIIAENLNFPDKYKEAGRWNREFVGLFLDDHEGEVPDVVAIGPSLILRTRDVEFASVFFNQGKRAIMEVSQDKMLKTWFTHGKLVVNSIEHNLRR